MPFSITLTTMDFGHSGLLLFGASTCIALRRVFLHLQFSFMAHRSPQLSTDWESYINFTTYKKTKKLLVIIF